MSMKKNVVTFAVGLCLCVLPFSSAFADGKLRIAGGSSPMENIFMKIQRPFREKTGIELELVYNGAVEAYKGLMSDQVDVATAGMGSLKQWQEMVARSGTNPEIKENMQWHIVGTYLIAVFTNTNIGLTELSKEQIKRIFTGNIRNWKEVGGPDAPIVVILGQKLPVLTQAFKDQVLDGAEYVPTAQYTGNSNDVLQKVMATPNSIAIGSSFQVKDGGINNIRYPGAPNLYISMLWKFNSPKRELAQTLYEYLGTAEGKKYTLSGRHEVYGDKSSSTSSGGPERK